MSKCEKCGEEVVGLLAWARHSCTPPVSMNEPITMADIKKMVDGLTKHQLRLQWYLSLGEAKVLVETIGVEMLKIMMGQYDEVVMGLKTMEYLKEQGFYDKQVSDPD